MFHYHYRQWLHVSEFLNFKVRSMSVADQNFIVSTHLRNVSITHPASSPVQSSPSGSRRQVIHYLVQTTQVSSFPLGKVSHGSVPHCTSIGCRTEFQAAELPVVISGAWSTQMAKVRILLSLASSPVRYPEYSLVQPVGQFILAGIIIDRVRPRTSQIAHGAGCMYSALPPLFSEEKTSFLPRPEYAKPYDAP